MEEISTTFQTIRNVCSHELWSPCTDS